MAETENKTPTTVNLMVPRQQLPIPLYANAWQLQIGETEITITFGVVTGSQDAGDAVFNPVTSITLSHGRFVAMATEIQALSLVLQDLYGGPVPGIKELTKSRIDAAIARVQEDNKSGS